MIPISTIILVALGVVFTVGGNSGQIISLNFWLNAFPAGAGPFTVLTLVGMSVAAMYGIALLGWILRQQPQIRFAFTPTSLAFCFACGLCYSLNGVLLVYATPSTPELMQAMLISTGVFWTFAAAAIAELLMGGTKNFRAMDKRAIVVPISFCLCAAGVIVGAGSYNFVDMTSEMKKWTVLFALAQVPGAVYNVLAGKYVARFSKADPGVSTVGTITSTMTFRSNDNASHERLTSDTVTVKLVLLVGSSAVQAVLLFCYFPLDWTPGYGTSANAAEAAKTFRENYRCVFFGCSADNFAYYVAFAVAYAFTMVGTIILNRFSAPMCSMVSQLAAPTAAILLIIIPSWNVTGQAYSVGGAIGALVLVTGGSLLYVYWARYLQSPAAEALARGESASLLDDDNAAGVNDPLYSNKQINSSDDTAV